MTWNKSLNHLFASELPRSKFRLLGLIGQGQFGRVYFASHRQTGQLVALKELDRQRFSTQQFLRELCILLSLHHENIVNCQTVEHTVTTRYLVMDYYEGGTLRHLLDENQQLHPLQGLEIVTQVLAGLEHAHQKGVIHCDVKPENILLTVTASGWKARMTDFGIARLIQERSREGFGDQGSPAYMAPERFVGLYSPASDLYAVGILLFELLVGHRPFSGSPLELMAAHQKQPVPIPRTMPASLQVVLQKALEKLPERRFRSAGEMSALLQEAIATCHAALTQGWATAALMRPYPVLNLTPSHSIHQEPVRSPLRILAAGPLDSPPPVSAARGDGDPDSPEPSIFEPGKPFPYLFRGEDSRIGEQIYPARAIGIKTSPLAATRAIPPLIPVHPWFINLPGPLRHLLIRPQGCFALTDSAIYLVSPAPLSSPDHWQTEQIDSGELAPLSRPSPGLRPRLPDPLMPLVGDSLVAIEARGEWLAIAPATPTPEHRDLGIWSLKQGIPQQTGRIRRTSPCFQILALDSRHLGVFSHLQEDSSPPSQGFQLELFTRHAQKLGAWQLPLALQQIFPTPIPYRLLTTEPDHPTSLLIIDLKPLRIQRIGLDLVPQWITTTAWGYVLMDTNGQIELLSPYGQVLGRIEGPTAPTAIATLDPYTLAISTWHQTSGSLHLIDLRTLDLDIIF